MINENSQPDFPGISKPSLDFEFVRDQRRSTLLYVDIDLATAHSFAAGTQITLPLAGNSFYVDQDLTNTGNAVVHFQDSVNAGSAPVYVNPGFIARVPFTQVVFENTEQAGKRLRVFYGVDVDFVAGVSATISIGAQPAPRSDFTNAQKTVTNASTQMYAANASRNYLLFQNNDATGIVYLGFGAGAVTAANGVKIPPGGFYELNSNVAQNAVQAIGSIASNANCVGVEG